MQEEVRVTLPFSRVSRVGCVCPKLDLPLWEASRSLRDQVSGLYLTATSVLWTSRLATRQVWSV
jgi:hypothetical protein